MGLFIRTGFRIFFYIVFIYMYIDIKCKVVFNYLLGVIMKLCRFLFILKDVLENSFYIE